MEYSMDLKEVSYLHELSAVAQCMGSPPPAVNTRTLKLTEGNLCVYIIVSHLLRTNRWTNDTRQGKAHCAGDSLWVVTFSFYRVVLVVRATLWLCKCPQISTDDEWHTHINTQDDFLLPPSFHDLWPPFDHASWVYLVFKSVFLACSYLLRIATAAYFDCCEINVWVV